MIEANKNELFPITVSLFDEGTAELVSEKIVVYDVRTINDAQLFPTVSGILVESTVESGIYKAEISIDSSGSYICYATCSGFITSTEEIMINDENIYELTKANRTHNVSVIDVQRTTTSGTASQIARNVPIGKTDYIITTIKADSASDWASPVGSGISYAHYTSSDEDLPFMIGGVF